MERIKKMKTIVFILLASFFALAQETDEETLSLPSEDPAPAAQQTTGSASVQSSQIKSSDAKKPDLS